MVALITGASKGIGFKTAELFRTNGYKVIITGRNEQKLIDEVGRLDSNAAYLVWDVADVKSAKAAVKKAHLLFGKINVFINNAGIVCDDDIGERAVGFFEKTEAGWDETMNINLKGLFFALQAEAMYMKENNIKGNIVNVCSEMGFRPAANAYCISKWGVRGMTMGIGKQLASLGIVVNGIAPGETATEILRQREGDIKKIALPRGVQASTEEIAEAIFFLSQSRNIIGEILVSDGGRSLF